MGELKLKRAHGNHPLKRKRYKKGMQSMNLGLDMFIHFYTRNEISKFY